MKRTVLLIGLGLRQWMTQVLAVTAWLAVTAAGANAATLKVSSFPSGAQVLVDGVATGKVTPMNIALAEGDHVVTVAIPNSGWSADTRTVTIITGNNDLSVTLLPIPVPGQSGPQGPSGPQGERGPAGPAGPAGDSPANVSTVVDLVAQSSEESPVFHVVSGQDYGTLESSCVSMGSPNDVRMTLRFHSTDGANYYTIVAGQLAVIGGELVERFQHLLVRPGVTIKVHDIESSPPSAMWLGYDLTVLRFAPSVSAFRDFSSAHVSVGMDASVDGVCRITTITRVD